MPSTRPSDTPVTENGYTLELEAELLAESEKYYVAVANKTATLYRNSTEMFADLDARGRR